MVVAFWQNVNTATQLTEKGHKLTTVDDINWSTWQPTERAVLCFIREEGRVMLIHKKTGLGAGKINAPGGRIQQGETPLEAAIRETVEEIGLEPADLQKVAELFFFFTDGYALHGTVYVSSRYSGCGPIETPEALPFWCDLDKIPYDKMWADDIHWLPLVFQGHYVHGYFIFDGDRMLSRRVEKRCPDGTLMCVDRADEDGLTSNG